MQLRYQSVDSNSFEVKLPASKSISNRVLIMNALSNAIEVPRNLSDCDDTNVMLNALKSDLKTIDIGAAGTAMRFLTAYLSITKGTHLLTGSKRMQERPIHVLVDALRALGAEIEYVAKEGYPPLSIQGKMLEGGDVKLAGNVSSQFISALLLIAPMLKKGLHLHLIGDVISKPYIDLTLQLMQEFGAKATWLSSSEIKVISQPYSPIAYTVESDWSAASYWYEIVALLPDFEVFLEGLNKKSFQGDARIQHLFSPLGVSTSFEKDGVILRKKEKELRDDVFRCDLIHQPDLAQTFIATCAFLELPFHFTGLQSLRIKETDRLAAMVKELDKMGYVLKEEGDEALSWLGERKQSMNQISFETYKDHRMAMSLAPAAFLIEEGVSINEPEVVSKSYPNYWEDLCSIGFSSF